MTTHELANILLQQEDVRARKETPCVDRSNFPDFYPIYDCGETEQFAYVRYIFPLKDFGIGEYVSMPNILLGKKDCFYKHQMYLFEPVPNKKVVLVMYMTIEPKPEDKPEIKITQPETITILPCYWDGDERKETYKDVDLLNSFSGFTYLHGTLEEMCGFDCIEFVDIPTKNIKINPAFGMIVGDRAKSIDWHRNHVHSNLNGTYRVKVLGVDEPCIGVFWYKSRTVKYKDRQFTVYEQYGRIVLESETHIL